MLIHKPSTQMVKPDTMSYLGHLKVTDADDNKARVILKPEHFHTVAATAFSPSDKSLEQQIRDYTNCKTKVAQALSVLKSKGPKCLANGAAEWKNIDGLIYYMDKLYILANKELHQTIIRSCHDTAAAGHLGCNATLELVSCLYWWPRMAADVSTYVLGCNHCQCYKPAQHPKLTLILQDTSEGHWEHVGIDLITQLPSSNGNMAICVIVNHFSSQCHLIPTYNLLNAEGTQNIYY